MWHTHTYTHTHTHTHTHIYIYIYCEMITTIVLISPHIMNMSVFVVIKFKIYSLTILSSSAKTKKNLPSQQMEDVNYSMIMSKQL